MPKSKNNDYKYRKTFTDVRGKRHNVYGNTKAELEEKLKASKEKWNRSLSYIENENLTLDQYYEEWINRRLQKKSIKESTYSNYNYLYNGIIKERIGNLKVQSITHRTIDNFYDDILKTKSPKRCNDTIVLLGGIFGAAKKSRIISENPCSDIELTKISKKEKRKASSGIHRALTLEEQRSFMEYAKKSSYYDFFVVMISTGMRCGEVAALRSKDIDYENNIIHISRTISLGEKGKPGMSESPKNYNSIRDIPLTGNVKDAITRQLEKDKGNNFEDIIFTTNCGKLITHKLVNHAIESVLQKMERNGAGIGKITSHCFRDTYATRCIECGMNPNTLKELLGHGSFSMTMDLYAHVLNTTKHEESKKVIIDV